MRPRFFIKTKRSFWVKPKKGEVLGHWTSKFEKASKVSLKEARIYVRDWRSFNVQAILVDEQ